MNVITRIQNGAATAEEAREALAPLIGAARDFDLQMAYTVTRRWVWKALETGRGDDTGMRAWAELLGAFAEHLKAGRPEYSGRFQALSDLLCHSISLGGAPVHQ